MDAPYSYEGHDLDILAELPNISIGSQINSVHGSKGELFFNRCPGFSFAARK
jgi:hypothetical protein